MNILYFHYILVVMMHFQDTVDTVSRDVFAISIYVIHCYEEYLQCLVVIHLVRRYSPGYYTGLRNISLSTNTYTYVVV